MNIVKSLQNSCTIFNKKKLAKLISFILDGSVLALPIFLSVFFMSGENILLRWPSLLISLMFLAIIPYSFILILYRKGKICDIHMPKRKERILPLLFINLSVFTGFTIMFFINPNGLFYSLYLVYLIGLPLLSIITVFWKISFHTSYVTIFSFALVAVYGKWAALSALLIPVIIWARVELKRHTIAQAFSGVMVTSIAAFIAFSLNNSNKDLHPALTSFLKIIKKDFFYVLPNAAVNYRNILFLVITFLIIIMYSRFMQDRKLI